MTGQQDWWLAPGRLAGEPVEPEKQEQELKIAAAQKQVAVSD